MKTKTSRGTMLPRRVGVWSSHGHNVTRPRVPVRNTAAKSGSTLVRAGRPVTQSDFERQFQRTQERGGDGDGGLQRRFLGDLYRQRLFGEPAGQSCAVV